MIFLYFSMNFPYVVIKPPFESIWDRTWGCTSSRSTMSDDPGATVIWAWFSTELHKYVVCINWWSIWSIWSVLVLILVEFLRSSTDPDTNGSFDESARKHHSDKLILNPFPQKHPFKTYLIQSFWNTCGKSLAVLMTLLTLNRPLLWLKSPTNRWKISLDFPGGWFHWIDEIRKKHTDLVPWKKRGESLFECLCHLVRGVYPIYISCIYIYG